MTCTPFTTPDGARGFVCSRDRRRPPRCRSCGRPADLLCDWKVPHRRSGTCDAPICFSCTTSPVPGKDLCPTHATAWTEGQAQRRLALP